MKKLSVVVLMVGLLLAPVSSGQAAEPKQGAAPPPPFSTFGATVDSRSGRPVPFVIVIAYQEDYLTPITATVTDRSGRFRLSGLPEEEFALRYIGSLVRYETGWQSCFRDVVPTTDEACTQGEGDQGEIRLDRRRR